MEDAAKTETLAPILVAIPDAARMIGRGTTFIYEALARGEIDGVKSGARTLVRVASLHRYANSLPAAKIDPRYGERGKRRQIERPARVGVRA